mgnify:CR=1 FL=1
MGWFIGYFSVKTPVNMWLGNANGKRIFKANSVLPDNGLPKLGKNGFIKWKENA